MFLLGKIKEKIIKTMKIIALTLSMGNTKKIPMKYRKLQIIVNHNVEYVNLNGFDVM